MIKALQYRRLEPDDSTGETDGGAPSPQRWDTRIGVPSGSPAAKTAGHPTHDHTYRGILLAVAILAVLVNALAIAGAQLWARPESSYDITLAGGIARGFDFTNELFLVRPPGYPLLLAGVFTLFGPYSSTAILVLQHTMLVGVAVLTALIAWHLSGSRMTMLLAGLFATCSLQLLTLANVVVPEISYALVLLAATHFLVRYAIEGRLSWLAAASAFSGLAYLFQPVGLTVVIPCLLALIHRAALMRPKKEKLVPRGSGLLRRFEQQKAGHPRPLGGIRRYTLFGLVLAVVPACLVAIPSVVLAYAAAGAPGFGRRVMLPFYERLRVADGLEAENSSAFSEIRSTVHQAALSGDGPATVDDRHWASVWHAFSAVRQAPLSDASAVMSRAALDLAKANLPVVLKNTFRYAYWQLRVPDSSYRFHAGGAPGVVEPTGECIPNPWADIYDVSTYKPVLRPALEPNRDYLLLSGAPKVATATWRAVARWYLAHVENGETVLGIGDSLYEELLWVCLAGVPASLLLRRRMTSLLVLSVLALQIGVAALLFGPEPRLGLPLKPLLLVFASLLPIGLMQGIRALLAAIRPVREKSLSVQ